MSDDRPHACLHLRRRPRAGRDRPAREYCDLNCRWAAWPNAAQAVEDAQALQLVEVLDGVEPHAGFPQRRRGRRAPTMPRWHKATVQAGDDWPAQPHSGRLEDRWR